MLWCAEEFRDFIKTIALLCKIPKYKYPYCASRTINSLIKFPEEQKKVLDPVKAPSFQGCDTGIAPSVRINSAWEGK